MSHYGPLAVFKVPMSFENLRTRMFTNLNKLCPRSNYEQGVPKDLFGLWVIETRLIVSHCFEFIVCEMRLLVSFTKHLLANLPKSGSQLR